MKIRQAPGSIGRRTSCFDPDSSIRQQASRFVPFMTDCVGCYVHYLAQRIIVREPRFNTRCVANVNALNVNVSNLEGVERECAEC